MAKQTIDEMAIIITANNQTMRGLDAAKKDLARYAKDVEKLAPPPKPVDLSAHRKAAREMGQIQKQLRESRESVLGFVGKVAATGGTLLAAEAGLSGLAGAFQEVKESVRMAADLEQTRLGFEVMLGDARRATELVADVRRFAASTPFNTRELTDATRQLIAYGRAADGVMDDLRMLGDVSAAFGDRLPIGELTYLYGTLYAQQRAFTKDIYQFAGRGIPIYRELAKVTGKSGMELRDMIEDGRVGFEDVRKAFVAMTSAGGQFHDMTARQGQTVAGVIEQAKDAFEMLRTEFGQVLIDELGIKQAAKDLGAFAERLRESTGVIRPAVRFAGDLAKAGAQISYEFARAGIQVAAINLDALDRTFPGLRQAAADFRQMVVDAQQFKIDEEKLIDFGTGMATILATNLGKVADFAGDSLRDVKRDYIDPLKKLIDDINALMDRVPRPRNLVPDWWGGLAGLGARWAAGPPEPLPPGAVPQGPPPPPPVGRRDGDPIDVALFGNVHPGQSAARLREEWRALRRATDEARGAALSMQAALGASQATVEQRDQALRHLRRIDDLRRGFLDSLEPVPDLEQQFDRGEIPQLRGQPPVELSFGQRAAKAVAEIRESLLADSRKRQLDAGLRQLTGHLRAAGTRAFDNPWYELATGGAAVAPPKPPNRVADQLALWSGALGGPAGLFKVEPPPIPPDVDALRTDIRREYDPRPEIGTLRRQLDEIKSRGLLGPNTDALVNRAWRDRLGQIGSRFGIDPHGRYALPEATTVGTAEDARIITSWQTQGQGPVNVESLLQQILRAIEQQTKVNEAIPRGIGREMPRPQIMQLPGQ